MFLIPIRNKDTGEEKNFFGAQDIADFLALRDDAAAWTGWEFLGALPAATASEVEAAAEVAAEPVAETPIEPAPEVTPAVEAAPEAVAEPVETLLHRIEEAVEHIVHPDAPSAGA